MISLSLALEREFDDYVTIRRLINATFSSVAIGDNLSIHIIIRYLYRSYIRVRPT